MSAPLLTSSGGIYQLEWMDEAVAMRLDRLTEDSKYNVTAEVAIKSRIPGVHPHIHQARLNLTSTTARNTISKYLAERLPAMAWHGMIEQACVLVLDKYREGAPVIALAGHPMPEGLQFRLKPFLQERQNSLFFGEGDTGKSWLLIYMGILVSHGITIHGMDAEPGAVLYLDYETDEDTLWDRVNRISQALDVPIPENFFYRQTFQTLAADIDQINRVVLENKISLVIVDSASPAVGEAESSQMTTDYFRALRSLRIATATIAHVSKGGKENEPFGSIFWRNLPRANFRVNASHEPGDDSFVIGLKHTKSNNGQRLKDMAFQIDFGDDGVSFNPATVTDYPDLAKGLSLGQRISAALLKGGLTVKELAETLDENSEVIRKTLNRGKGRFYQQLDTNMGQPHWGNLATDTN